MKPETAAAQSRLTGNLQGCHHILPRMSLFKILKNSIVERLDRTHDENTTKLAQLLEQGRMFYDVFHFRRHVESQVGKVFMELSCHSKRVSDRVEKVGISEGDVLGAHVDQSRYVFPDDVALDDAQTPFVNRRDRTMQAGVKTAATRLHIPYQFEIVARIQAGVLLQRRQKVPDGRKEHLATQKRIGLDGRCRNPFQIDGHIRRRLTGT